MNGLLALQDGINEQRETHHYEGQCRDTSAGRTVFEPKNWSALLSPLRPRSAAVGRIALRTGAIQFRSRGGNRGSIRPTKAAPSGNQNPALIFILADSRIGYSAASWEMAVSSLSFKVSSLSFKERGGAASGLLSFTNPASHKAC
jgi:hypothetical protein